MTLPMLALIIHCHYFGNESYVFQPFTLLKLNCLTHSLFFASSVYIPKRPLISVFHSDHSLNFVFTSHCNQDNSVRLKDLGP